MAASVDCTELRCTHFARRRQQNVGQTQTAVGVNPPSERANSGGKTASRSGLGPFGALAKRKRAETDANDEPFVRSRASAVPAAV